MNQNAVMAEAEEIMSTESTSDAFAEHGEFLPLSVWATRGFAADLIEERSHPMDKKIHPILGDTYRVRIAMTTHTEVRSNTRKSSATWQPNQRAASRRRIEDGETQLTLAGPAAVLALEDEHPCPSDSGSRSSSSSSSSSRHKKKSKKDKKKSNKDKKKHKKDSCV